MSEQNGDKDKDIFGLDPAQLAKRLQPGVDAIKQKRFSKGLPLVYQDDRCPTERHYIHEYEDGRTYLMLFDANSREYTLIKDLGRA
jgi:hypothetical protein